MSFCPRIFQKRSVENETPDPEEQYYHFLYEPLKIVNYEKLFKIIVYNL